MPILLGVLTIIITGFILEILDGKHQKEITLSYSQFLQETQEMPKSHTLIRNFTRHYNNEVPIVRTQRGTNLASFDIDEFHIEASNSDDNPNIFCDLYRNYTHIMSITGNDLDELHSIIADETSKELEY